MKVDILLTCEEHLHDHIISLRVIKLVNFDTLYWSVGTKPWECVDMYMYYWYWFDLSTILILDFGTVPIMWYMYFFVFHFIIGITSAMKAIKIYTLTSMCLQFTSNMCNILPKRQIYTCSRKHLDITSFSAVWITTQKIYSTCGRKH